VALVAQQAELFGRGLYNDPITKDAAQAERILTNFDSLAQTGVARDFEQQWTIVHAFETLDNMFTHSTYGSAALEKCIATGRGCGLAITPLADWACLTNGDLEPLVSLRHSMLRLPATGALGAVRYISRYFGNQFTPANEGNEWDANDIRADFANSMTSQCLLLWTATCLTCIT